MTPADSGFAHRRTANQLTGRIGEDAATQYYEERGFTVVARNVHMSHKEIDLIVSNDEYLVFVEVKTRQAAYGGRSRYGRPADAVDTAKREHTVAAVQLYLREHPTTLQPRIDVVEVYLNRRVDCDGQAAFCVERVVQFRNAFGAR